MAKIFCIYCKHSASENVCKNPLNKRYAETYYSDLQTTLYTQSERNLINQCTWYERRGKLSQLWYDITQCET